MFRFVISVSIVSIRFGLNCKHTIPATVQIIAVAGISIVLLAHGNSHYNFSNLALFYLYIYTFLRVQDWSTIHIKEHGS